MHRFLRWPPALVLAGAVLAMAPLAARAYPDTYEGRLQALAQVQALNADLLSRPSATETLRQWCARLGLANPPDVHASAVVGPGRPPSPQVRALLGVGPKQEVKYRHVELTCGGQVLSEADNWYLPARLTPEMNRALETTDTPFGVVVRPLAFQRRTLEALVLFRPFPTDNAATTPPGRLATPLYVLQHKALLTTPDGAPLSVVVETYTRTLIETPKTP
jgi:hypothetical protein